MAIISWQKEDGQKGNKFKQTYRPTRMRQPGGPQAAADDKKRKAGTCYTPKEIIFKFSLFVLPFKNQN